MVAKKPYIARFYEIMDNLKAQLGGYYYLSECSGKTKLPMRGVYFFFENGETREDNTGLRCVRVGTHAVSERSKTTLWNRLKTHKGNNNFTGNHRRSVFRLLLGEALKTRNSVLIEACPYWAKGSSLPKEVRDNEDLLQSEIELEIMVSKITTAMPFLFINIDDQLGTKSRRAVIEKASIMLLTNWIEPKHNLPSKSWLGHSSSHEKIRLSGLWNRDYIDSSFSSENEIGCFLDELEQYAKSTHFHK